MKIIWKTFKLFISLVLLSVAGICALYFTCYLLGAPTLEMNYDTVFLDKNEEVIEQETSQNEPISLTDISHLLIDAVIVVEDNDFYNHYGFDFKGIARAIIKNIQTSRLKEGASTITQQLAKNLYLSHEKTWTRKVKEAIYTIRLEMFYSKDEILASYMNTIYYGHGAYGIDAASVLFFNKNSNDLTLAEATMLAGIPKGPTYYSPFNNLDKATERQHLILRMLLNDKKITSAQYYQAVSEKLEFNEEEHEDGVAKHFIDLSLREASTILNQDVDTLLQNGYTIHTTLDLKMQQNLYSTVTNNIAPENTIEIGSLSLNPENGAILALIGGNPYKKNAYNRAIDAKRMVGSTFKPFLYYAALENGYTPTTTLVSEPTVFASDDSSTYQPKNYNGYYADKPITLAEAIAVSDNIYAVKTNLFLNPATVIETTRSFGITSDLPDVPSLALGSASISVDEMVTGYGMIANGGKKINSYTIDKITSREQKVIYQREQAEPLQVLNRQKAFILTHLMTGMFDKRLNGYTEVTGTAIIPKLTKLYAGKSGTTDSDSWMIGYSPSIVTGVWIGYDDNRPLTKVSDTAIAKHVWADFMELAHENVVNNDFPVPKDVVWKMIDPDSGLIATQKCPINKLTYFERGTEPIQICQTHFPVKGEELKEEPEEEGLLKRILKFFS